MAPAMKRPAVASAAVETPKKKVKTIAKALADGDPAAFPIDMITSMLEFSLGEYKDTRHEYQSEVVSMAGEALAGMEMAMSAELAEAEAKTQKVHEDKEERKADAQKAEAAIPGLKAALEEKKAAETAASTESKEAEASLKAAKDAQKTGDKDILAAIAKKEQLENVMAELYTPVKEKAADKKTSKALLAIGKKFDFDSSLLASLGPAATKAPEARTQFDGMIIGQMDSEFAKHLEVLAKEIAEGEPGKAEREKAVVDAQAAYDAAAAKHEAALEAYKAAQKELKEGEKTFKAASTRVQTWLTDIKVLFDDLEESQGKIAAFREGPMKLYSELKDMETPAPAPEEPEEQEAAPDPVEEAPAATPEGAPAAAAEDVPATTEDAPAATEDAAAEPATATADV